MELIIKDVLGPGINLVYLFRLFFALFPAGMLYLFEITFDISSSLLTRKVRFNFFEENYVFGR